MEMVQDRYSNSGLSHNTITNNIHDTKARNLFQLTKIKNVAR